MKIRRTLTALSALTIVSACLPPEKGNVDDARDALPRAETLKINVPESGAAAKPANLGEISDMYKLTRATAGILNGGAAIILVMVRTVTLFPPTTVEDGTYTWGPWDGNALQPSQYRLVVRQQDDGDYEWSFEGRRKHSEGDFKMVISGVATPGAQPGRGSGTFTMDFNVAEELDPVGNTGEGVLSVRYDLDTQPASIGIDWEDAAGRTVEYTYSEARDGSGDFQFVSYDDSDDPGPAFETFEIRSRWSETGAGRSDARISGGDLGQVSHRLSECWNTSFVTTYHMDTAGWQGVQGSPSSCVFPEAQ